MSAPVLPQAVFASLGRINVICGRNNSGKSTLLQAIATSSARSMGLQLDRQALEGIAVRALAGTGWRGSTSNQRENMIFDGICARVLQSRRVWYRNDDTIFASAVAEAWKEDRDLSRWAIDLPLVAQAFRHQFPQDWPTVLLPPKRSLQLTREIALSESIAPDGGGVLNFLFLAKNQPNGDPKRVLYERLLTAFELISTGYRFEVFAKEDNKIQLNFARADGGWIPAAMCGLGLQDLLVILYFALVEEPSVVLIEEPESHMHPDMQRRLLSYLRDGTGKQYFLTTHSNVYLSNALVDRVFFASYNGIVSVSDETSRASVLGDLGYSVADNLVSDLVILVEGPTDTPIIEEFLRKAGLYTKYEIKIWPLGGDIMDQVDLSVFAERYKLIALIDRDPGSSRVRRRFQEKCLAASIPVHQLSGYAIENYFTLQAIRSVFMGQVPPSLTSIDRDRPLEDQLGFSVKRNNRRIAQAMGLADINGGDLGAFIDAVGEMLGA